jgi:transcriptional regulator with XRE-family HTH domain
MHDKLKKYFEEKGITQQQIADALGVSLQYVNQILNGKKFLGKKNAERLANLFGLSKSFLLTGEGYVESDGRQHKITERAHDIQMAVLGHLVKEPEVVEGIAADEDPRPYLPTWADTLLGILSKQIAENEVLHSELRQSISDVQDMKQQLAELIEKIKKVKL